MYGSVRVCFSFSPLQVAVSAVFSLSGGSANQVELQLQRSMAPVSLHQWEVSQAGLPGPLPAPGPRPGPGPGPGPWPRPAAHSWGAVCERGRVQTAWYTTGATRLQGRRNHHRYMCACESQLFRNEEDTVLISVCIIVIFLWILESFISPRIVYIVLSSTEQKHNNLQVELHSNNI